MSSSEATTQGVRVRVRSEYSDERSDPTQGMWLFAYTIHIFNEGDETVQLISRHWTITDGNGRVEEVKGPGVVGAQPVLAPGESFEYTSACPLRTPLGSMRGTFQMVRERGEDFDAEVASFSLSAPNTIN